MSPPLGNTRGIKPQKNHTAGHNSRLFLSRCFLLNLCNPLIFSIMANTIIVTPQTNNFTFQYNTIVKDYALNDLNYFVNTTDNRFLDITERRKDGRQYKIDVQNDTIDVNGTTVFANALALAEALRPFFFGTGGVGIQGNVAQLQWDFDEDTTAGDPGAGKLRYNSNDPNLITTAYVSKTDKLGNIIDSYLQSVVPTDAIYYYQQSDDISKRGIVKISGPIIDGGGYAQMPVSFQSFGALPDDGKTFGVAWNYPRSTDEVKNELSLLGEAGIEDAGETTVINVQGDWYDVTIAPGLTLLPNSNGFQANGNTEIEYTGPSLLFVKKVFVNLCFSGSVAKNYEYRILKNGAQIGIKQCQNAQTTGVYVGVKATTILSKNDVFKVQVRSTNGTGNITTEDLHFLIHG